MMWCLSACRILKALHERICVRRAAHREAEKYAVAKRPPREPRGVHHADPGVQRKEHLQHAGVTCSGLSPHKR
eukprot:288133-Pleurochrysis_carterae.AAC.2